MPYARIDSVHSLHYAWYTSPRVYTLLWFLFKHVQIFWSSWHSLMHGLLHFLISWPESLSTRDLFKWFRDVVITCGVGWGRGNLANTGECGGHSSAGLWWFQLLPRICMVSIVAVFQEDACTQKSISFGFVCNGNDKRAPQYWTTVHFHSFPIFTTHNDRYKTVLLSCTSLNERLSIYDYLDVPVRTVPL